MEHASTAEMECNQWSEKARERLIVFSLEQHDWIIQAGKDEKHNIKNN